MRRVSEWMRIQREREGEPSDRVIIAHPVEKARMEGVGS